MSAAVKSVGRKPLADEIVTRAERLRAKAERLQAQVDAMFDEAKQLEAAGHILAKHNGSLS